MVDIIMESWINGWKNYLLTYSVIESKDEVASSYTRIGAFFNTALAMATLCFSPPKNVYVF